MPGAAVWCRLEVLACTARAPERSRAIGAVCGARQEEQGAVAFQPEVTRKQGSNPVCFLELILSMAITSPDCSGYEEDVGWCLLRELRSTSSIPKQCCLEVWCSGDVLCCSLLCLLLPRAAPGHLFPSQHFLVGQEDGMITS